MFHSRSGIRRWLAWLHACLLAFLQACLWHIAHTACNMFSCQFLWFTQKFIIILKSYLIIYTHAHIYSLPLKQTVLYQMTSLAMFFSLANACIKPHMVQYMCYINSIWWKFSFCCRDWPGIERKYGLLNSTRQFLTSSKSTGCSEDCLRLLSFSEKKCLHLLLLFFFWSVK